MRGLQGRLAPVLCFTVLVDGNPQIRISDNGSGTSLEALDHLLLSNANLPIETDANGWGIIFCKRIMQSFGGGIEINSELDNGTTVILSFPVKQ